MNAKRGKEAAGLRKFQISCYQDGMDVFEVDFSGVWHELALLRDTL